jgi:hypothetical protein
VKRARWVAWWVACLIGIPVLAACDEGPAGTPIVVDPHTGMTSYCLADGSGVRVYERQFPMGGTQPLFSVIYTGGMRPYNPAWCKETD